MGVTATNLMMGPVSIYTGLFGVTEPANAEAAVGTGWTDSGGTTDGATLTFSETHTPLVADQLGMEAGAQLTGQEVTVATNMAETLLTNLQLVLNQEVDAEADEVEWGGEDIVNDERPYRAVMLRGKKPGGGPRMWIVRRCLSIESIGVPFAKDGQTVFPVTWKGYYISPSVRAVRVSDKTAA